MRTAVLFRYDLRIKHNPALFAARNDHILPIFIYPEDTMGKNSQAYLQNSLHALNESLGKKLIVLKSTSSLPALLKKYNIDNVYWNRAYTPKQIKADTQLKKTLSQYNPKSYNGSLLFEPWKVLKDDQSPYSVFTPFYKSCLKQPPKESQSTTKFTFVAHNERSNFTTPTLLNKTEASEKAALKKFRYFIKHHLKGYKHNRDFFSATGTSLLSCHLHFGEISPHFIWDTLTAQIGQYPDADIECFLKELIWREFSYYQLYHFPALTHQNWQKKFDRFPWKKNTKHFNAWKKGQTGIPLVDAGMRELANTGYMHNRVRMVTASFLVKNLQIHWKEGEQWFWENLYDADLAANNANWQWVAGSGFDAAPFFRIFNPILQSKKFDPDAKYISQHVPELADLPLKERFEPQTHTNYPEPIVDLKTSREAALKAFKSLS